MMLSRCCSIITLTLATSMMVGCASKPVVHRSSSSGSTITVPKYYTVQRGDTLSEIAYRYGLNYRQIGRINGLDANYTIHVGQRLNLAPSKTTIRTIPYQSKKRWTREPLTTSTSTTPLPSSSSQSVTPIQTDWQRPISGPVLKAFNLNQGIKGIQYTGNEGDPIYASRSGEVIYAADELPEYGNLILVKHDADYITAYAHVKRMLVKQTDSVRAGDQIAILGRTASNQQTVMFEFQVRRQGKPVDPQSVLSN